jgi:hypothetical protein
MLIGLCVVAVVTSVPSLRSRFSSPPAIKSSYAQACEAARGYALRRFLDDSYREVLIGDCAALSVLEQDDGSWIIVGAAEATQYGAPARIRWTARIATLAQDGAPQICDFASANSSGDYRPRLLSVSGCR